MSKDSWVTESGLLDDFDFKVEDAWFGQDEENDDERVFLFLRGEAKVDGEVVDDEHRERYSTGKNWEVVEDGAEVENATGKNRFNQNAGLGRLINALVAIDGAAEYLADRGDAFQAATYEGMKMHMERKIVSRWKNDDGEEVEWALNLPTTLKVKKGGSGKASRGKGKGKAAKSESSLRSDVIGFANEFDPDEHDEFVDQVLDGEIFDKAEAVMEDDELHAEILDPESELWAEAHS